MNTKTASAFDYTVIRSNRKTICAQVKIDGSVVVRSPKFCSDKEIERFVFNYEDRISKLLEKQKEKSQNRKNYTEEEIEILRKKAKEILPPKVEYYATVMQVNPTAIHITSAKTRYGSCSGKNSINFSLYLMDKSERCIDYVVVHELSHILHHDHSKAFYHTIEQVFPDYKQREKELRNGG